MAISAKKVIKRSISDGVGVSSGQPPGTPAGAQTGISTRQRSGGGGGGGQVIVETPQQQEQQKQISQQAEFRQRAIAAQQQKQQEEEKVRRSEQERYQRERAPKTTTGVYEKGGAVVQETRGDYETLKKLEAQQPGSRLTQVGDEYVLVKAKGLDLRNQSNLATVNENIAAEGGTPYKPVKEKLPGGGFLNLVSVSDTLGISEPEPPTSPQPEGSTTGPILSPDIPTKYRIEVGSGIGTAEQAGSTLYKVGLEDSLGGVQSQRKLSQKEIELYWKYHPRELANGISEGIYENQFIGKKGPDILAYERIGKKEEETQVFPITYTTEEGKPLVTITGKSEGAEFKIFSTDKTPPFIPKDTTLIGPAGSNTIISTKKEDYRILPAYGPPTKPETQGPPKKNIVQQAEEKSPLYPLIGEFGKGSKESLKGYIKQGYHLGIEAGLMFVPPEISGIDKPEKREELRQMFEKSYPKELQPKETPLTNLLAGKLPITQYGLKYDIGATATDIFLLGSGIPKIEKLAQAPALIKKIPGAIKEAPEAIKSFLK